MTDLAFVGSIMFAAGAITGFSFRQTISEPPPCEKCLKYEIIVEQLNKTIDAMIVNFKKIHTFARVLPSSTLSLVIDHLLTRQLRGD